MQLETAARPSAIADRHHSFLLATIAASDVSGLSETILVGGCGEVRTIQSMLLLGRTPKKMDWRWTEPPQLFCQQDWPQKVDSF